MPSGQRLAIDLGAERGYSPMPYSNGLKARMLRRLTGPDRVSANKLAQDIGISQNTLSRWLREAGGEERRERRGKTVKRSGPAIGSRPVRPDDLPPAEKFRLVMEASVLSEDELGEFLRRNGLHEAQLEEWRQKVEEAAVGVLGKPKKGRRHKSLEAKRVQQLERELHRKDKALAEVTALLALKKKLEILFQGEDDDTTVRNGR